MRVRVQVVIEADDAEEERPAVMHEVAQLERGELAVDTLGLQLTEAKDLLQNVQAVVVDEQVRRCLADQVPCASCGRACGHKDAKTIVVRTLFGTVRLPSPRWYHCLCQPQPTRTFSPLAAALPERTTPELRYLESKFAGLVSYGLSAKLLAETLPLGRPLHASAVQRQVQATAQRLEDELGPEQAMFADGCQRDLDALPQPDLPLTVGLDGGYVHSSQQRSPAAVVLAQAAGGRFASYVTRDQARTIINAAATTTHRLLLETLWQSGGRVTEVLRLRPRDLDPGAPILHLVNLKQRPQRGGHLPHKAVIVSPDLVAALRALTNDAHIANTGYFFGSRKSQGRPMSYGHCWRLIRRYAIMAGIHVVGSDGRVRPATGRDFRHGAAVNQVRQGVPLSEVQQQLGHARIDTTTGYTKLAARPPGGPRRRRVVAGATTGRR